MQLGNMPYAIACYSVMELVERINLAYKPMYNIAKGKNKRHVFVSHNILRNLISHCG